MEPANSTTIFEESHVTSKKKHVSAVDKEPIEGLMDHYEEPIFFFRGAIYGLILCVPFWVAILWFIT
jgi:hypothetical protein